MIRRERSRKCCRAPIGFKTEEQTRTFMPIDALWQFPDLFQVGTMPFFPVYPFI
jgi:hypothetical protein